MLFCYTGIYGHKKTSDYCDIHHPNDWLHVARLGYVLRAYRPSLGRDLLYLKRIRVTTIEDAWYDHVRRYPVKAIFRQNGVQFECETGQVDAAMLHTLWRASVKFGCHIQLPVKHGDKTLYINIRCLDSVSTFEGMILPSQTLPPPPFTPAGGLPSPDG